MRPLFSEAELRALLQRGEGQFLNLPRYVAARELKRLVDVQILQRAGERRGAHYIPGPSLVLEEDKK